MKSINALLVSIVFLSACSSFDAKQKQDNWPAGLPAKEHFIAYYYHDRKQQEASTLDGYLMWVKRFYLGWELYRKGWLQATHELVETIDIPDEKLRAREKAFAIGKLVSAEWAKDKGHRVINTRHLSIWGNALNESTLQEEQLRMLDKILDDASTLLERKMQPRDIVQTRYYEAEPFGDNFQ
jgi:hypothetical protein